MKKYSHWVFDLDGTVIDSCRVYEMSLHSILGEFGINPSAEEIDRAYHFFNPENYFETFFAEKSKIDHCVQRLIAMNHEYADQIPVFEGMQDLIAFLRSKNVEVSFWTGREIHSSLKILKTSGLDQHMKYCVTRSCVPRNKPFPDGLVKILEDSKHHGDDVLMIGDHEYDIKGAQAAQVQSVSVGWSLRAHAEARKISNYHFDQVNELRQWAEKIY